MDPSELKARPKQFGLSVIKLVRSLPNTPDGRAVAVQLVRAGTSVGANYRACCRARSRREFIAKIGIAEEEADESCYWLEVIIESDMLKAKLVQPLAREGQELTKILAKSRISASRGGYSAN